MGTDNNPVTREQLMLSVEASGKYEGSCSFTETEGPIGRVMNNSITREALGWEPKYESFDACMQKL